MIWVSDPDSVAENESVIMFDATPSAGFVIVPTRPLPPNTTLPTNEHSNEKEVLAV